MEQIPFQKIVVPLDGSKWAEKAIPHAEQIARGGGELMLVHIFKPAGSEFLSDSTIAKQTSHFDDARDRAEQYVKGLRSRVSSQNIKVSAHMIEGSDVAQLICKFVNAEDVDVVVMPAASHNRLARMLMGDLTASITGCAKACLLLVRGSVEAEWHEESQKKLDARKADTAPDPALLLQQLVSLKDAGLLTDDEFETKRGALEAL